MNTGPRFPPTPDLQVSTWTGSTLSYDGGLKDGKRAKGNVFLVAANDARRAYRDAVAAILARG
jgi:hypothetical protein